MSTVIDDNLADALLALTALDRADLARRWVEVFGCPVPRSIQASFMLRALAWHCQMAAQARDGKNGVDRLHRKLRRSVATSAVNDSMAPGTRLLREWRGRTHHVTALVKGFEYSGKTYRSLTAITRQITGTPWSGPKFFGLRS